MRVIDLFCGCGGLSLGFQHEGFDIIAAFDNWDKAIDVYNANFLHKATNIDINILEPEVLKNYNPDMIIGGPPCQDYSSAGKQDESLGRAVLTIKFAELVCSIKPKWFVMENVDRITKSRMLTQSIDLYKLAGYGLTQIVLDASLCGVPQKRKRFFLIGELNGEDDFLTTMLNQNLNSTPMSIYDYLGNELNTEFYYRHPRSYERRAIFSIYEPSPTIRGVNRPIPQNYKIHKNDATDCIDKVRVLTSLERARIQTFPENYKFNNCNKTDLEQMIGNAVPVNLANYVAHNLMTYIVSKNNYKINDIQYELV